MTSRKKAAQQQAIVDAHIEKIWSLITTEIEAGKIPPTWTEAELRLYLSDAFAKEAPKGNLSVRRRVARDTKSCSLLY